MAINIPLKAVFDDRELKKGLASLKSFGKTAALGAAAAFAGAGIAAVNFGLSTIKGVEIAQTANRRLANITEQMGLFGDQTDIVTKRLSDFAEANELSLAIDADVIKAAQAKLMTFKELAMTADEAGGAFDRATMAALDLAAAGFGSAEQNAVQLGKALNDPIKGITALARSGVTFTEQEKEKIKTLVESGKMLEAQNVILEALETQVGGTADATALSSEKIRLAFERFKDTIGEALLPVIDDLVPIIVDDLAPAMGELAEEAVPFLVAMMEGLAQAFTDMNDPSTVLGGAMEDLSEAIGLVFDSMSSSSDEAQQFSDSIGVVIDGVAFLTATFAAVLSGFQGFAYAMDQASKGNWGEVWRFLTTDTIEYANSVEEAKAATEAANSADLSGLVGQLDAVRIAAYDATTQTQNLTVAVDAARPDFSRFGVKPTVDVPVQLRATSSGGGAAKKDPVKEFMDKLKDDIAKEAAKVKLGDLGLSEPLITDILGSGADWEQIYNHIVKGGKSAAEAMQKLFDEANGQLEEVGDNAKKLEEELGALAQVQLAFYDRLVERYEANQAAIKALNADVQSLFDNFRQAGQIEESFGEAEQAVADLTSGLRDLIAAQDSSFVSERNKRKIQEYLSDVSADMMAVARQRDELASRLTEAKAVFADYFDSIVGSVDITKFKGKSESIIKQLRKQVQAQAKFQEDIKKLRATGLSQQALEQIQKAGVDAGGATAQALLTGGQGAIDEVNSLYAQLGDIATSATEAQLGPMFGAGVDLSNGLIAGLEAQADQYRIVAEGLALEFADSFESVLNRNIRRLARPDPEAWAAFAAEYAQAQQAIAGTLRPGQMVQYGPGDIVNGIQLPSQPISNPDSRGQITINVTAGMGADGTDIGRKIVDEIKKYERRNGSVFVPAVM